jgi:exonuclease III
MECDTNYSYFRLVEAISEGHDETTIAKHHYDNIQYNTCYNKFLFYNHLPLLSHPQTIISFLRHIHSFGYSLENACGYTLTISIKNDHSEAHVYLPSEAKPLPNHFILPIQAIWHYPNIQLKSNTSIPVFSIPAPLAPIPSNLAQPRNPNTSSLNLTICTHNVRGYNENLKQQVWEDYCITHSLNIISITETKIAEDNAITKFNNSKHYSYYWSCTNSSKAGTALMIHKHLTPHIHNILTSPGYAIAIDLFFKHNHKFRIISVYLPCENSQLRLQIQNTIIQWIQEATNRNILPIILGDFNVPPNNSTSSSIKYKLLQFLQYNNIYDLADHTNTSSHTWHSSRHHSTIDYIWAYLPLLKYLNSFYLDDAENCTQSDHKILISF